MWKIWRPPNFPPEPGFLRSGDFPRGITKGKSPEVGEVWKLENQLADLMELCRKVLSDDPLMVLLTTHSPGVSALALKNLILKFLAPLDSGSFQMGDMFLPDTGSGLHLPNGFYARWTAPPRGEEAGQTRSRG